MTNSRTAFLAPDGLLDEVLEEASPVEAVYGNLVLTAKKNAKSLWAQNTWFDVQEIPIRSISDAAKSLRDIQRNWVLYPVEHHRRAQLIQEALPHITFRQFTFGTPLPKAPLGAWTLLEPNLMLAAKQCSSAFPNGELQFVEDKDTPPSRAYLKLWEAFTLLERSPGRGDRCLDAGASPGGWTWVLSELGAEVVAVDRSPLIEHLMENPKVTFVKGNAFSEEVLSRGPFEWIFSDVACYPDKLYEWAEPLANANPQTNFICTLKFQGKDGYAIIKKFAAMKNSRIVHLFHNKHELTWIRMGA